MSYPTPTPDQVAFFQRHGWLVVQDAIPQADLDLIETHCQRLIDEKESLAYDWAWDARESKDERTFRIIQSRPHFVWPEIEDQPFRKWLAMFGSGLMNLQMEFWYDQFLGKPPGKSVPTYWHQDEGYWGRNLDDKGITCWIPLHDVDATNGCMHFIDGGHRQGVLTHHLVDGVQSDLLTCEVDEADMVVCPLSRGDVTFHHSKTPHMTTANTGDAYRKALANHMQAVGAGGEGDHYPWKVKVNQHTGDRSRPGEGA
ncbi:phytanoyl-CoA dioxygenase family protein [Phenylobacterium sp.]|uniref:phytanoyl-CoA dioxygenase family protein n=1 Tax=Phenylobacterium sp. TaxID=1871053 RepID=UPI0025F4B1A7|nr:phytanoyl-CoA dioxygenase family protein [Phenylobacterium sp.]